MISLSPPTICNSALRVLTGKGAQIDTTTASGRMVFGIFATLAEFERDLIRERTMAGLASARARGRKGGRKFALTKAQVRLAQAAMAQRDTSVSDLCKELGIERVTLTDMSVPKASSETMEACSRTYVVDLPRFRSGLLRALFVIKETIYSLKHSDEFKRDAVRIALTSGLTRRQVASDLSIGLSTLGKWIASISDETKIPTQDTDLLRENERLRKENRILREERRY